MIKLIVQIPCYNEEKTLRQTYADLPQTLDGVDVIETQIIDDGSTDNTLKIAKELGIDHIITFNKNQGLASAFKAGVNNALVQSADILVNTDGDNQYKGKDIQKLVSKIIEEDADLVVGCRPIKHHPEFSIFKKFLQIIGSWVLRLVSKTDVKDAASGFRAYGRNALLRLNIYSDFSYCMETLISLGFYNMKIIDVEVGVNLKTRESRLYRNTFQYIWKQSLTIINIILLYKAGTVFTIFSLFFFLVSILLASRFFILIAFYGGLLGAFWPSVVLSGVLLSIALILFVTGIVTSAISANRKLLEEILIKNRIMNENYNEKVTQKNYLKGE